MSSPRTPGDLLLHPVAIAAVVVVIVNDRLLKVRYPSELSGKLSDFAGLVFFPLFLVSAVEAGRWLFRVRPWELTFRAVVIATTVVGASIVLIKTWHPAGEVYRTIMGVVSWPGDAASSVIEGDGLPPVGRANLVMDVTDLVALVSLALPLWVGHRVMTHPRGRHVEELNPAP